MSCYSEPCLTLASLGWSSSSGDVHAKFGAHFGLRSGVLSHLGHSCLLVFCSDSRILPSPTPGPSTCLPNYYRCSSGACVMDSWVCDGYRDCADGSDEEACPSPGECSLPAPAAPAFVEWTFQGMPWAQNGQAQCPLPSGTLCSVARAA